MDKCRILVLFAHPSQHRSEANRPLFQRAIDHPDVTAVDLYREYPRFNINIDVEQQRLKDHDVIVFQFPFYWYSTPAILKEWQDLVLEYNFAYGTDGTALTDKRFICVLTAGGKATAYQKDGHNHFTVRELLQPLEQMANLTGMQYLPPLALFGSRTAPDEGRLAPHADSYTKLLNIVSQTTDFPSSLDTDITINDWVEQYRMEETL